MSGDSVRVALPLFQTERGGSTPTSPLQLHISKISHQIAAAFVEDWHYSHRIPTGKNFYYGLWNGSALYAVIVYGIGVNPYQAEYLNANKVIEIKRLCRTEPRIECFPLSRLIAITSKMVLIEYSYDCIVAFADPEHGHEGKVYKASGFTLHGQTNPEWHLMDDVGEIRHRRYAFRYARRNGISVSDARKKLGVIRVVTAPKNRWVKYRNAAAAIAKVEGGK